MVQIKSAVPPNVTPITGSSQLMKYSSLRPLKKRDWHFGRTDKFGESFVIAFRVARSSSFASMGLGQRGNGTLPCSCFPNIAGLCPELSSFPSQLCVACLYTALSETKPPICLCQLDSTGITEIIFHFKHISWCNTQVRFLQHLWSRGGRRMLKEDVKYFPVKYCF